MLIVNTVFRTGPEDGGDVCEELVAGGVLPLALAAIQGSNEDMQAKGAELVAELAKVKFCHTPAYSLTFYLCQDFFCFIYLS